MKKELIIVQTFGKDGFLTGYKVNGELVRCKDCCYWDRETVRQNSNDVRWWNEAVCVKHSVVGNEHHEMWTDAGWFCADGERR